MTNLPIPGEADLKDPELYTAQVDQLTADIPLMLLVAGVNDLDDGDSGVDKDGAAATRKVRARKVEQSAGGKGKGKRKSRANIVSLHGWEWDSREEFTVERLIGKMAADGVTEVPGRTNVKEGTEFDGALQGAVGGLPAGDRHVRPHARSG